MSSPLHQSGAAGRDRPAAWFVSPRASNCRRARSRTSQNGRLILAAAAPAHNHPLQSLHSSSLSRQNQAHPLAYLLPPPPAAASAFLQGPLPLGWLWHTLRLVSGPHSPVHIRARHLAPARKRRTHLGARVCVGSSSSNSSSVVAPSMPRARTRGKQSGRLAVDDDRPFLALVSGTFLIPTVPKSLASRSRSFGISCRMSNPGILGDGRPVRPRGRLEFSARCYSSLSPSFSSQACVRVCLGHHHPDPAKRGHLQRRRYYTTGGPSVLVRGAALGRPRRNWPSQSVTQSALSSAMPPGAKPGSLARVPYHATRYPPPNSCCAASSTLTTQSGSLWSLSIKATDISTCPGDGCGLGAPWFGTSKRPSNPEG